jgi:hypothetical protein
MWVFGLSELSAVILYTTRRGPETQPRYALRALGLELFRAVLRGLKHGGFDEVAA